MEDKIVHIGLHSLGNGSKSIIVYLLYFKGKKFTKRLILNNIHNQSELVEKSLSILVDFLKDDSRNIDVFIDLKSIDYNEDFYDNLNIDDLPLSLETKNALKVRDIRLINYNDTFKNYINEEIKYGVKCTLLQN